MPSKATLMRVLLFVAVGLGAILVYKKVAKVQELVNKLPGFKE